MQASSGTRSLGALARELDSHWVQVARFILSRRSALHHGAAAELSAAQVHALDALRSGPLRMGDLAERLGIAESTATRLADRLCATHLVERGSWGGDRRCVSVGLTEAGRALMREIASDRRGFLREILASIAPEEREDLTRLFAKLAGALPRRQHEAAS